MSARRSARTSTSRFHASAIRERAAVIAALLALPYLNAEQAAVVAQTSASTIRRACGDGLGAGANGGA